MVISDLCDGEGVERRSEGEDRRAIWPVCQSGPVFGDVDSLTKSP